MPAMEKPNLVKIDSKQTAKRVVKYLGLMAKERKNSKKLEESLKGKLRPFMANNGHSKIVANDGSYATLEDVEKSPLDLSRIAAVLDMTVPELKEKFATKVTSTRLTCRPPA